MDKHVREFIFECLGVLRGREVVMRLAPMPPASREATDHLLDAALRACDDITFIIFQDIPIAIALGNAGLAEVLLTTISVATWDQSAGISAFSISKTTEPSVFLMRLTRLS
jgi:hypothetical protein